MKSIKGKYIGNLLSYDSGYDEWKAGKKGRWITVKGAHIYILEGEKKQAILDKIRSLEKTQILKREKAIQKLIEETGYRRKRAEAEIDKKMGKEEPKKPPKKEPTKKEKVQKKIPKELVRKEKEISKKIQKLREINKRKYGSVVLDTLLSMIVNYLITGNENTSQFVHMLLQIQKTKKIDKNKKKFLTQEIQRLRKEIRTFHERKDYTEDLTYDFVDDLNDITLDFYEQKGDFTILHGPITRSGAFEYEKNGKSVIYYKDWGNIKEVVKKIDYIPLKATIEKGAHYSKILGYATNFKPNDKTQQMFADVVLFNNIEEVTNLLNPENGYAVSIGFKDRIENGIQWIEYIDHLALSLLNLDTDRCSTLGGKSCYAKQKEVNN